jgi:hypothetical protein
MTGPVAIGDYLDLGVAPSDSALHALRGELAGRGLTVEQDERGWRVVSLLPPTRDTTPDLAAIELPIRAGEAALTVAAAVSNLVGAVVALEKVAMACARALDASKGAP